MGFDAGHLAAILAVLVLAPKAKYIFLISKYLRVA
jgi:hypothetical protein